MKKNNDIQEWLQLYDTPAIPENKMNELISAGKKYMDSAESVSYTHLAGN